MPRLYLDVDTFLSTPEALTFPAQVAMLQKTPGALDRFLAQATKRVDSYCKKKICAPGSTTIATGGISAGQSVLPVTSTLGFDNGQELAVLLNPGQGNAEILPVVPGGVALSNTASPYPGTIQLASPALYSHTQGEIVQGLYQEVSTVGSSGSSDVYSESLLELNQAAQLARAHAPQFDTSGLTRVIFVKEYPIVQLYKIEHMLPIDTSYESLDASQVGIHPSAGYLRLPLGSFVLPEGLFRTTYTAGFANVPDEIQQATALYAADALQRMVSMGAAQMQQGKLRGVYRNTNQTVSNYVQDAQTILNDGNFVRKT